MNAIHTIYRRTLSVAVVAVVFSLAATASAQSVTTEIRLETAIATDSSVDAFEDDNEMAGFQLGAGWGWDNAVPGLRTMLSWRYSGLQTDKNRLGNQVEMDYDNHRFMAMADWGPDFWGFFHPFGRVGAGYALQNLTVDSGGPHLDDWAHDLAGQASIGIELHPPSNWAIGGQPVQFGISGQFGYTLQTLAQFDELGFDEDDFDDEDPWSREQADLGSLDINGFFWDIGLSAAFPL